MFFPKRALWFIVAIVLGTFASVAAALVESGGYNFFPKIRITNSSSVDSIQIPNAPSGSNAIAIGTNGARVDVGAGASDYFSSNGTTISTPAPFDALSYTTTAGAAACGYTLELNGYLCGASSTNTISWDGTNWAVNKTISSSVGSGGTAFQATGGARIYVDATRYMSGGGTTIDFTGGSVQAASGFVTNNAYTSNATSGVQFACGGAASCQLRSASGQSTLVDCGGGTCTVGVGNITATTTTVGRVGQTTNLNGTIAFGTALPAITSTGNITTSSTSTPTLGCTGAATCNFGSASGQVASLDTGGGTAAVNIGTTNATSVSIGRSGQATTLNGTVTGTDAEFIYPFAIIATGVGTGVIAQHTMVNAGVYIGAKYINQAVGVGAGNLVLKLCIDGATCAVGKVYTTCTLSCTASAGTVTTCAAGDATTWVANDVLTWSIATACATEPVGNGYASLVNN